MPEVPKPKIKSRNWQGGITCRHCAHKFAFINGGVGLGDDMEGMWSIIAQECPNCERFNFELYCNPRGEEWDTGDLIIEWPLKEGKPCPSEIPTHLADDYKEASAVLAYSPKSSAALSRRCMQQLFKEQGHTQHNLVDQITAVLNSKTLPSQVADDVDAVRHIGNFAAHTTKSQHSGEIMDVEPQEAEWNLEVLYDLFQHYYIVPAAKQKRRDEFNAKLAEAGKPQLKQPPP